MRVPGYRFDPSKRIDASLIMAVAVWLIFNSHTEAYHPYPWLAADGMLGNALFYFISGFGIQSSLRARRQIFVEFAGRRLSRIYPPLLIVGLLHWSVLSRDIHMDAFEALGSYIYPTGYTYIKVVLPCYVGLWILSHVSVRWLYLSIAFALALMVWVYLCEMPRVLTAGKLSLGSLPEPLWDGYFWILVASGSVAARLEVRAAMTKARVLLVLALLLAYFGVKFVLLVKDMAVVLFPILFVLVYALCLLSLTTFSAPTLVQRVMHYPVVGPMLGLSAALTLEIYLIHEPLTQLTSISSLSYPANLMVLLGITLPIAIVVGIAASYIQRHLEFAVVRGPPTPEQRRRAAGKRGAGKRAGR